MCLTCKTDKNGFTAAVWEFYHCCYLKTNICNKHFSSLNRYYCLLTKLEHKLQSLTVHSNLLLKHLLIFKEICKKTKRVFILLFTTNKSANPRNLEASQYRLKFLSKLKYTWSWEVFLENNVKNANQHDFSLTNQTNFIFSYVIRIWINWRSQLLLTLLTFCSIDIFMRKLPFISNFMRKLHLDRNHINLVPNLSYPKHRCK